MAEGEEGPQWKYWNRFMKKAGLPRGFCSKYATKFTENDVKIDQLSEAVKEDNLMFVFLTHVGVDKVGHVMRIHTEARKLQYNTVQAEEIDLLKIEEDESSLGDGEHTMVEREEVDEIMGEYGESSMAEEDSTPPVTDTLRKTCNHAQNEICLNCRICLKHLNLKSLPRHMIKQHQILTVPVTNKRLGNSSTLGPAPVEGPGGQSSSAVQSPDDNESDEDAISIVPPPSTGVPPFSGIRSGTVQGVVEPLLIRVKKAVLKDQSGIEPSSQKKACRLVKKLKKSQWLVVDPKTKSSHLASKTPAKENKLVPAKPSFDRKVVGASDFVTGTSRFGRMRKSKKIQSV